VLLLGLRKMLLLLGLCAAIRSDLRDLRSGAPETDEEIRETKSDGSGARWDFHGVST